MYIVTYEEYNSEVVKCDWCNNNLERKQMKHWVTGSRLCPGCYKEAGDKWNKFLEKFRKEIGQGTLSYTVG